MILCISNILITIVSVFSSNTRGIWSQIFRVFWKCLTLIQREMVEQSIARTIVYCHFVDSEISLQNIRDGHTHSAKWRHTGCILHCVSKRWRQVCIIVCLLQRKSFRLWVSVDLYVNESGSSKDSIKSRFRGERLLQSLRAWNSQRNWCNEVHRTFHKRN